MQSTKQVLRGARDLVLVFLVAVAVALAGTVMGSVLDHTHRVSAEELVARTAKATATQNGTQLLVLKDWGVQATLPLATELPLLTYASHDGANIGLSSADAARLGEVCIAQNNALGLLTRAPVGTFATAHRDGPTKHYVAAIGEYEYTYQIPQNACTDTATGQALVNRETSIILNALDSLGPISQ